MNMLVLFSFCQKLLHDDKGNDKFLNPDYVASLYLEKILRYLGKVYLLTWAKIDLSVVKPYCWLKNVDEIAADHMIQ